MFTTGNHTYLYFVIACYALALGLWLFKYRKTGAAIVFIGWFIHGLYLLGRGWLGDVFIPNSIVEGAFFLPWCLATIVLINEFVYDDRHSKGLLVLTLLFLLFSLYYAKGMIPPTPKKVTVWAMMFFISESFAHALFYCAAYFAVLTILKKQSTHGFESYIFWGFTAYSIAQVTGAVWCYLGWGNTFNWSSRHLGSAAVWTLYAACLHFKYLSGWSEMRKAYWIIACGIFVLLVSFSSYINEMGFPRIGG